MAVYARLASHVFSSFEEFKDWIIIQQFDISSRPERAPILKAGQRVVITDTKSVYIVSKHITDGADILSPDPKGGFYPQLLEGQDFLFTVYSPQRPRLDAAPASAAGTTTLVLNEAYAAQNMAITLGFDAQKENHKKMSSIHVLSEGNVTLNTGAFTVDTWTGEGNERYRPGKVIALHRNSSYICILQNASLVSLIETGRSTFDLSQDIPEHPGAASATAIPSEKAVSESILNLNTKLTEAIEASSGFLRYAGVDPSTNIIIEVDEDNAASDIAYAVNTKEDLATPSIENLFSLVLNNNTSVSVFKSEAVVQPTFAANPNYLGIGSYGTVDVSQAISVAFPLAKQRNIVSNTDTNTEWEYNGATWIETVRPAEESKYAFNLSYLGVYAFRQTPSLIGKAIGMVFPLAVTNNVVNNTVTSTEWKKTATTWLDTGKAIGTSVPILNSKVSGRFEWDNSDPAMVKAALYIRYGTSQDNGKIIQVAGSTEWIYDAYNASNPWSDTGNPGGTSNDIPNLRYLGEGSYGTGASAANAIMLAYPSARANDVVGNKDSDSDWKFIGATWSDTKEALGLNKVMPNPLYGGVYTFDQNNTGEVSAVIGGKYPFAKKGDVVYNLSTSTEWVKEVDWSNTYKPNYTTPERVPDPNVLGTFNYLENWTSPAETLNALFPSASYGSFVCNTSTGTEWELSSASMFWIDTGRPIGSTAVEGNNRYLGTSPYKTNPPIDTYILPLAHKNATENQFVTNLTTDSHWVFLRGRWVNTRAKDMNKWLFDQVGVYKWGLKEISGIKPGYVFHLTTRYPETSNSEVYWFANSWNSLDFDAQSTGPFSNAVSGVILGKETFGYVAAEKDAKDNSVGKVSGLTDRGFGDKFLNDAGEYTSAVTVKTLVNDVSLYMNLTSGDDANTGLSASQAWKTPALLKMYLLSASSSYKYTPGTNAYPSRITLYMLGTNSLEDLVIENAPHLTIIGPSSVIATCKRLHIVNSTVVLKDIIIQDRLVVWKSKVSIASPVTCKGINLVDSVMEQLAKVTIPSADSGIPVIDIDSTSSFYHNGHLYCQANLANNTPYINLLGSYTKGPLGTFENNLVSNLKGIKISVGSKGQVVGATLNWLNNNIPYAGYATADMLNTVSVPSIRTLLSTEDKTGYQIADGRDLAEVIRGSGGMLVKATIAEALRVPVGERFLGMMIYIQQMKGLYYFRDGILDKDLIRYIVPHYNITNVVYPCHTDAWANQFPYQNVDNENFLTNSDQTPYEDPVQSYVKSDELDWNSHTNPGYFYIQSVANLSVGAPRNVTSWWWLTVGTHIFNGTQPRVFQEAKQHSDTGHRLVRISENGVWGSWVYNYTQYSG